MAGVELEADGNMLAEWMSCKLSNFSESRLAMYKRRIRDETDQEERRRLLLQEQKEKRQGLLNQRRNIVLDDVNNAEINDDEDKWDNEKKFMRSSEEMEWASVNKTVDWHKRVPLYNNMLMLSEWLYEKPFDLESMWTAVPCPVGNRNLLITKRNHAVSYSRRGSTICNFKSSIPPNSILDCIWVKASESFYVLDVIQWNGMSLLNCQTDFRFYWLDSKFQENPEYGERTLYNEYPVLNLQRCSFSELSKLTNTYPLFPDNTPVLDAFLFYHNETFYTKGKTPLVGWLKPYMFLEAIGVEYNSEYDSTKPSDYTTFDAFVKAKEQKSKGLDESSESMEQ